MALAIIAWVCGMIAGAGAGTKGMADKEISRCQFPGKCRLIVLHPRCGHKFNGVDFNTDSAGVEWEWLIIWQQG